MAVLCVPLNWLASLYFLQFFTLNPTRLPVLPWVNPLTTVWFQQKLTRYENVTQPMLCGALQIWVVRGKHESNPMFNRVATYNTQVPPHSKGLSISETSVFEQTTNYCRSCVRLPLSVVKHSVLAYVAGSVSSHSPTSWTWANMPYM